MHAEIFSIKLSTTNTFHKKTCSVLQNDKLAVVTPIYKNWVPSYSLSCEGCKHFVLSLYSNVFGMFVCESLKLHIFSFFACLVRIFFSQSEEPCTLLELPIHSEHNSLCPISVNKSIHKLPLNACNAIRMHTSQCIALVTIQPCNSRCIQNIVLLQNQALVPKHNDAKYEFPKMC